MSTPTPWQFLPGVQRDGTDFSSKAYNEYIWTRTQRGLPRKIGGYSLITDALAGVPRQINQFFKNDFIYFTVGEPSFLEALTTDKTNVPSGIYDRTPGAGFVADPDNSWQFDTLYDSAGTETVLAAHAAPNLASIASSTARPYFIGDVTGTGALVQVVGSDVSGGIVCLQPYLFRYGDNIIAWSDANLPDTITGGDAGSAKVTGAKIVKGLPLRGNGSGPAGLFWSLDSLIRATYIGSTAIFAFDTISADISVLSPNCIVEHDGIYYWAGVDRFQMFNGVVREIPNSMNFNWFFEGLNQQQHEKVFVHKVPYYGEIWWCYPKDNSTECNWAVIFNTKDNTWYDTPLPADFRSCSVYAQQYHYPVMGSQTTRASTKNCLWQHETGVDEIYGVNALAIRAAFTTSNLSLTQLGQDRSLVLSIVEWDALQSGDITISVTSQANPRAPIIDGGSYVLPEPTAAGLSAEEQVARFTVSGNNVVFTVESNQIGGDFQIGNVLCNLDTEERRVTS